MDMDVQHIPIILDIEASGFGRGSYPIEIGVAIVDGGAHCYLVKPETDWTHWEPEAEAMHHITREILQRFGWGVNYVAAQLNKHLQGKTVYSDAWGQDSAWLARLYECSNTLQDFRVEHLVSITSEAQLAIWEITKQQVITESGLQRHRASADARIIQTTWLRSLVNCRVAAM